MSPPRKAESRYGSEVFQSEYLSYIETEKVSDTFSKI